MAISDLLNRRVRAQPEDDDEVYSGGSAEEGSNESEPVSGEDEASEGSEGSASSIGSDLDEDKDEHDDEDEIEGEDSAEDDDSNNDIQSSINTISFGALAKAQASMGSKKPKASTKPESAPAEPTPSPLDDIRARIRTAREQKQQSKSKEKRKEKESRMSKHAPAIQSTKRAVTRKRPVVDLASTTGPKARDPRFDPTILSQNASHQNNPAAAKEAYAFLDTYRDSELKELKERLAKTKDPEAKEALRREVRSAGDRMRTLTNRKRQEDVLAEHKREERRLIREGKKSTPYFLKKSELRQQALVKKYQGMKGRERSKVLERRRKKVASRERREMPTERRVDGGAVDGDGGGRKRKRLG